MKKILVLLMLAISLDGLAQKTLTQLQTEATTIRDEKTPGANTATRVGQTILDYANSLVPVIDYAVATGTNAYSATVNSVVTQYVHGQTFRIEFQNANTGSSTLNLNGLGAILLTTDGSTALTSGVIAAGQQFNVYYNGTAFQLSGGGGGGITSFNARTGAITSQLGDYTAALGGTGINTSSSTGIAQVNAGTWSVSTALSNGTTATTQTAGDNSTKISTTAYVDALTLTIGTGLTNISGTLTVDLSTGKSGGQSAIGGKDAGNSLTLSSTSNATKGNIIFGSSSYSEFNNTLALVLNNPGSTISSSWTGTASGQSVISESGTITTRSSAAGGNADTYSWKIINPTYVMGASSNSQDLYALQIIGTFPTNTHSAASLFINSTHNGNAAASYLIQAQSAATDRFRVFNNGNITSNGLVIDLTASTSIALRSAATTYSNSGTNLDVSLFNTGGSAVWRHRATNVNVYTFNDGTNDIFTVSNSQWTFNRSVRYSYVAKTGSYTLTTADYAIEVTSGTNTQTLPTAASVPGLSYFITNSGSGVVTVATTSSQTFVNVSGTPTTLTLNQFQGAKVMSNGANWLKISSF